MDYRLGSQEGSHGKLMSVQEHLCSSVSCLGTCLAQTSWSPRLSYTIEPTDPSVIFNFCLFNVIDLSICNNHDSGSLQCVFAG
jgi:hypothetical protein